MAAVGLRRGLLTPTCFPPGICSRRPRLPQLLAPERAVLTELKVVLSCVPTAVTAAMIKTERR